MQKITAAAAARRASGSQLSTSSSSQAWWMEKRNAMPTMPFFVHCLGRMERTT